MIRAFRVLLIYGGKESEKIAKRMKDAINVSNYPILVTMVDNNYKGALPTPTMERKIFDAIDGIDYALVVLTKELEIKGKDTITYTAKPNLWLEVGYVKKMIAPEYIKYLTNFPYSCVEKQEFMTASDLPLVDYKQVTDDENPEKIWKVLSGQLCFEHTLPVLPKDNANMLLFNPQYKTNYKHLFSESELIALSGEHPEKQYYSLWEKWSNDHTEFYKADYKSENGAKENTYRIDQWHLLYLFERVVFFVLFPRSLRKNLNYFYYRPSEEFEELRGVERIYNAVLEYNMKHDGKNAPGFYERLFDTLSREYNALPETAPIVRIISENYCGLARLNQVLAHDENKIYLSDEKKQRYLEEAKEHFEKVIALDNLESLGDTLEVFVGFASYNLARVQELREEFRHAKMLFEDAIRVREGLSNEDKFPEVVRLYFLSEMFLAKLKYYNFALNHPELAIEIDETVLNEIESKVDDMSKTVQFSVPLFQHVLDRLEEVKKRIK